METAGSLGLVAAGGGAPSCAYRQDKQEDEDKQEGEDKQGGEDKWNRGEWRTALEVHISGVYLGLRG